jgi:hypothetical protein
MPRYFFHVHDGLLTEDEEGTDLPDIDAARAFAMDCVRDMVCDDIKQGWLNLEHQIDVADDAGAQILSMTFREAFDFRG